MHALMPCPMCGEDIEDNVEICPYCSENFVGVWRKGKVVVMRKDASLPPRCIKTNEPAETWLPRTLVWHPSWVYILILFGLLFYVIVAVIVQKQVKIKIGLSDEVARKRRKTILIAWLLFLGGIGTAIGGFALLHGDQPVVTLLIGLISSFTGIIYGLLAARMIVAEKITDDYVMFKGACQSYLDELPEWDGE